MRLRHLIPLLRLRFLAVPLVPQYLGLVLATRELLPVDWPGTVLRWLLAMLASTLSLCSSHLLNDSCDLEDDRLNPRRRSSPLVLGLVTQREAVAWSIGLRIAAVLVAASVSPGFFLTMLVATALSVAYSVPPLRLKSRAGWDILVNAGATGLLYPLAGWTIARPPAGFPWLLQLHFIASLAGPLLLTMVYDLPSDRASGLRTTAVRLGSRGTLRLSLSLVLVAQALLVVFAAFRFVISPLFLVYALPVAVLQVRVILRARPLRDEPRPLKRYVYSTAGTALLPYVLWALYLGGVLPR